MRWTSKTFAIGIVASAMWLACGHEPAVCPENLSIDLSNVGLDVYNATFLNMTGSGSGAFNCTHGGNGTVTGSYQAGMYNLTFQFAACSYAGTLGTLTLTGAMTQANNTTTHVDTGHADALMISGSESSCMANPLDATCEVDWSFDGRDSDNIPTGSGSVCGLTFP